MAEGLSDGHQFRVLGCCCSFLSLALLAALHLFCFCCFPLPWDGHGSYLYQCVAFEWQSCQGLLLLCYGLASVGLGVSLFTSARHMWHGAVSIRLALGTLAMEVALHTLPAPPVYAAERDIGERRGAGDAVRLLFVPLGGLSRAG